MIIGVNMTDELKPQDAPKAAEPKKFEVTQAQLDEYAKQMRQQITNEVLTSVQNQVTLIQIRAQAMDLAIKSGTKAPLSERAEEIYLWLINQQKPKQ